MFEKKLEMMAFCIVECVLDVVCASLLKRILLQVSNHREQQPRRCVCGQQEEGRLFGADPGVHRSARPNER